MRVVQLLLALLLVSTGALAQSASVEGVHLSWRADRDAFTVMFHSDLPQQEFDTAYTVDGEEHPSPVVVTRPSYGQSSAYGFIIPSDASAYRIDDRSFDVRAGDPNDDARVAFLADIGMSDETEALLDAAATEGAEVILMGGDLSYADGDRDAWDEWFDFIEPHASGVPIIPARGNHEARCLGRGGVNLVADCTTDERMYLSRFDLPLEELYYATEWGAVRVVVIDTEAYYPRADPIYQAVNVDPDVQAAFLADALRAPPDVWTVVMMHRPLYSSNGGHGSELVARDHLEPILVDGGADLVLAGHDHAYERTWPVAFGEPAETDGNVFASESPVYVMAGGGGRSLYTSWQPEPTWSAVRVAQYHYVFLEASADQLSVTARTANGTVLDAFVMVRPDGEAAAPSPLLPALACMIVAGAVARHGSRRPT